MKNFVNDQLRRFELIQEKQKIINELNELEVASAVSVVIPNERSLGYPYRIQINENVLSWLENVGINTGISESTTPVILLDTFFDDTSASLLTGDLDLWINSFFKERFTVRVKIKAIEKTHFKVFTP